MMELKRHVQKIARPLRATVRRQLKIREELLAHLQGIYEEELERLGEHDAAVRAAIERFGPADELARELKASVPWYDCVLRLVLPFPPHGRWPLTVLRFTVWSWGVSLILIALELPLIVRLISGRWIGFELFAVWLFLAFFYPPMIMTLAGTIGATSGVLGEPKSLRRAFIFGTGLFSCFLVCRLMPVLLNPATGAEIVRRLIIAIPVALFATVFVAIGSKCLAGQVRAEDDTLQRLKEWERLEISSE